MPVSRGSDDAFGFALIDVMMTVAITAIVLAIAVPTATNGLDSLKLTGQSREVERELHQARLRAVSSNRPMRVRFNCPNQGQYRVIEVTGVAGTDTDVNRCDPTAYPFPGPRDNDPATPAHDGPPRKLDSLATFTAVDLEFSPNGTTRKLVSGTLTPIATFETISVTRNGKSKEIAVNALGRIRLLQ